MTSYVHIPEAELVLAVEQPGNDSDVAMLVRRCMEEQRSLIVQMIVAGGLTHRAVNFGALTRVDVTTKPPANEVETVAFSFPSLGPSRTV
jgi:hypothetical protein